jgi:phosphomannomutase
VTGDLDRIFKAYDVRGVVPDDLDADLVRVIGAAFARWSGARSIVIGRDCRLSSPELALAIAEGASASGVDVVDLGLASTDLLYFASGSLDMPGIMLTASHNPKQYNGLKFCLAGARPVGEETGLRTIREMVEQGPRPAAREPGSVRTQDLLGAYVEHVLSFIDVTAMRSFTIVADTANGMGGLVVPAVMERLPVKLHHLYPELDGTFPNHPADPIDPENQKDLKAAVLEHGADIGLAFDGDADRVFLIDEHAQDVSGSLLTALVAISMLEHEPGAKIVHNLICSWTVPEVIREHGGEPVRTRVGHSFIKQVMAETGAIFGGEHSGHYYFRENYRADSGLIAAVAALGELSKADRPLSELLAPLRRYVASGEINSVVDDPVARIEEIAAHFAPPGTQDRLDGLTVEFDDWWCNVRPSNTEPLLRLNAEARTPELLAEKTAEVLALIRGGADDEKERP